MRKLIMEEQPMPLVLSIFGLILNLTYYIKVNIFLQTYGIGNFNNFTKNVVRIIQSNDVERLALLTFMGSVLLIGLLIITWYCAIRPILDSIFESNTMWWLTIFIYITNAIMTVVLIKAVLILWILLIICGIYSAANSNSAS